MASDKKETTTEGTTNETNEDDSSLIFCVDVSGSMGCSHEVIKDGKMTYVSRIKLINDALLKQLEEMKQTSPHV